MINLLVSSNKDEWESNTSFMERSRCLTEYIMPNFKERFGGFGDQEIEELKRLPCIFAYEQFCHKDAHIGTIIDISVRQNNVYIEYQLSGEIIRYENLIDIAKLLDLGTWELNRTHWTIKNINMEKLKPYFSDIKDHKPCVFISYSWTPIENQRFVFELVDKLVKDGINVIYDKNNLRPGQNKDYFMETALSDNEIDYVLVMCNKEYADKADERRGGVGYESEIILSQIMSKPLQTRIIPVAVETDENGYAYLPKFLKSRYYIDLTRETGYEELISFIKSTK